MSPEKRNNSREHDAVLDPTSAHLIHKLGDVVDKVVDHDILGIFTGLRADLIQSKLFRGAHVGVWEWDLVTCQTTRD